MAPYVSERTRSVTHMERLGRKRTQVSLRERHLYGEKKKYWKTIDVVKNVLSWDVKDSR